MRRPPSLKTSRASWLIAGLLAALAGYGCEAPPAADSRTEVIGPPLNVAVVRFDDKGTTVEFNRLGEAMAETLAHDLGEFSQLRILERTRSGELIFERNLRETSITADGTGDGEKLVAEYLVTGTCTVNGEKLVVTANLAKVGDGASQKSCRHEGTVDDFLTFETAIVKELSESMKVNPAARRKLSPAQGKASPTLAVLSLTNEGPSSSMDVMQEGFAEILQSSLGAVDGIRLVDRTQIESILAEQNLSLSGLVDPKTAVQVGQLLRAERLLVGSFLRIGPSLDIHTRLVDAQTGAIVASQRVSGASDTFSQLIEELTLRIGSDLSMASAEDAGAAVQAALPARSLEAAIHFATATRRMSEGRRPQAVDAYQQVLLLEPGNISCYARQLAAQWELGRLTDLERTANQALARNEFAAAPAEQRLEVLWKLAYGCSELNQYAELVRVTDRILQEFPDAVHNVNSLRGSTLMRLNRFEEGVALMESAAAGDPNPATDWKNLGLQQLFRFYAFDIMDWRVPIALRTTEKTREGCRRALQIFDRVLLSAAGKRDREARTWAQLFVPNLATFLMYKDKDGYNQLYLSPAERADTMRRALEVFDWIPETAAEGNFSLGVNAEEAELWDQALRGYRGFLQACPSLEQVAGLHQGMIPSFFDSEQVQPNTWIDKKIEAYYRLAKIEQDGLEQSEKAANAFRDMVREVGIANFRGSEAVASLAKLDLQPQYPEKCALVWGWESNGQRCWERVLGSAGFKVHSLRIPVVTPAQLAPYSLVILIRSGTKIFTPAEIFALRSYVAEGGSLLAVISPGWEPAAPTIHNGLLTFFNMEAGTALPPKVSATRIAEHPITKGISDATAKCGAALRAPPESALLSAGDDVLLAATDYRFGRVVVASFGQWLLPEPAIFPGGWQHYRTGHWTSQVAAADLPFETGANLCRPLLDNVIRWLGEPRARRKEFDRWKAELAAARWTAWRVHARSLDWDAMAEPHSRLIASAFDSTSREESLWTAGEAYFNLRSFPQTDHLMSPTYGHVPQTSHNPEPGYYQQLIDAFPDSPLLHYAEWRLADCRRVENLFRAGASSAGRGASRELISAFDKVSAPRGTYSWAWARLRQGALAIYLRDLPAATRWLQEVVDSVPHGPERTMALAMTGDCLMKAGQTAEARRMFEELSSQPVISWSNTGDWLIEWYPITAAHHSSQQVSVDALGKLGKQ